MEKELKACQEENESLLAQRKMLTNSKASVVKEVEKLKQEQETERKEFEQNLQQLRAANERLMDSTDKIVQEKDQLEQ